MPNVVDASVVSRRLLILNEALGHLASRMQLISGESLRNDPLLRAAIERWLQVAIEACIDLAYHIISERCWKPADSARGAFLRLSEHGLLDAGLASRLGLAAGLRNLIVHEYAEVDLAVLSDAARDGLAELRQFGAVIGSLLPRT